MVPRVFRDETTDVEAQKKLLKEKKKKETDKKEDKKDDGGGSGGKTICMMAESPFRILKVRKKLNIQSESSTCRSN